MAVGLNRTYEWISTARALPQPLPGGCSPTWSAPWQAASPERFGRRCHSVHTKQVADRLFVVDNHMEVRARNGQVAMPCSRAHFRKRTSTGQRVADKRVPAVMDG
jgi:hypothetical protein